MSSVMSPNARGILAMVASMFFFHIGDALFKIMGVTLPIGEMLLIRGLFATLIVLAAAWWMDELKLIKRVLTPIMAVRTLAEIGCSVLFFIGLLQLSFADAAAIGQFTPLLVMAGAALFLNEPVGWRRWSAAAVGFVGVLLIVKPGTSAFQPASLILFASMVCVAIRDLITRRMPSDVPTVLITLSSAIGGFLVGPLMAPFEEWRTVTSSEVVLIAICAVTVLLGYAFIILGMRWGDTAVVSPFRYTYMVFALLTSFYIFNERPDAASWFGIALVVGSGLYMVQREQAVRRAARIASGSTVPVAATSKVS
jgi:drug/metabolite transporter (DMT)-like permease